MKSKKKIRGMLICFVMCLSMLYSGTIMAHAVQTVCRGEHNFCKVRNAGTITIGNAISHNHDGYYCSMVEKQDMKLERCYCEIERVVPDGGSYIVHYVDYSRKY